MRHEAYSRTFMEKYSSGRRGAPAKGVGRVTGAEVQIFSSPPEKAHICLPRQCVLFSTKSDLTRNKSTLVDEIVAR